MGLCAAMAAVILGAAQVIVIDKVAAGSRRPPISVPWLQLVEHRAQPAITGHL
ncbi:hypothetical protein O6072_13265 [Mycolicibacterium neoaurum]|uniref:hypothetical protein n=1 Tax=Mycolicibacterium neoaurum TaxID=1795 RepID=UPI00248CD1F0|nr:hypothetical protein [Mycolicibacterium neoaurum]WBP96974.1 hypothetical protein O7W24_12805 [Mycolicibacterium neoaurum]WBS10746.1 hypothetical protein O6072_13265 [Mycolicibacterium neoaurum]